jgi:hypothetical protein
MFPVQVGIFTEGLREIETATDAVDMAVLVRSAVLAASVGVSRAGRH